MLHLSTEQRFQLLVDNAIEFAMIVVDPDGTILEWSRGAEALLGWPAAEAVGRPVAMIFTHDDRAAAKPQVELQTATLLGRASDVRWHVRKDGSTVFCDGTVSSLYGADGKTLVGFGKVVRAAYTPAASGPGGARPDQAGQRGFLAAVLESVENGIVACDKEGRLTFFNEAARQVHGMEEIALSYRDWASHYRLYRPDGTTLLPVAEIPLYRALKGERVDGAEIVIEAADGRRRHMQVSGRALEDGHGHTLGAVVSMNDVTPHRDAVREQGRRVEAEASNDRLRKAEAQLRLAADAAGLGIWTWDMAGDTGTWENDRMYAIFGMRPGAPIVNGAHMLADHLDARDVARFRQAVDAMSGEGARFAFTGRFHWPGDPQVRWIELTGARQHGPRGEALVIGTAADITRRKGDEDALEEARLRLEATLTAGEVGTWIWNMRQDRLVADPNLARLFGMPDAQAPDLPLARYVEAIHPDDADAVRRAIRHAIDAREAYRATYRIAGADNVYRWVSARGKVDYDGGGQAILMAGIVMDITPQKEAQDRLRLTEERYRTLIASMDEAFGIVQVLVDAQGRPVDYRFEEVNAAFEQQSGLVGAAGKTIREMVPDIEPHWIEIYGRVALTREPARFVERSTAMGYWWDVYATPMGPPAERRIAILFTDVTARMRAEDNLRRTAADLSEANRRKTEFLATLAHELRNPLAPLRTGLDLLRMTGKAAAANDRALGMMDRQLRQMVHLIDDLMDVSRINSGKIVLKRERLDLCAAIANAVEAAAPAVQAARHRLEVELPQHGVPVDADATRLAQIFGNLLANAVKYTPKGGHIALRCTTAGGAAVVTVADTGVGIPAAEQAGVFEMFSQVSKHLGHAQGGLGIGLSLVRSLVAMHGGTIDVASAGTGQGSTFTLTLPLAAAPGQARQDAPAGPAPAAAPVALRILLADDNVDAAEMLGSLLATWGHAVESVVDGTAAFERIVATRPDLAILDIGMPGLSGYEVARKVRAAPGLAPVMLVALTGWGGNLDRARSEEAGFDAHLTKPAGMAELEHVLGRAVARAGGRRP